MHKRSELPDTQLDDDDRNVVETSSHSITDEKDDSAQRGTKHPTVDESSTILGKDAVVDPGDGRLSRRTATAAAYRSRTRPTLCGDQRIASVNGHATRLERNARRARINMINNLVASHSSTAPGEETRHD